LVDVGIKGEKYGKRYRKHDDVDHARQQRPLPEHPALAEKGQTAKGKPKTASSVEKSPHTS
jgi:hypothetical protein